MELGIYTLLKEAEQSSRSFAATFDWFLWYLSVDSV